MSKKRKRHPDQVVDLTEYTSITVVVIDTSGRPRTYIRRVPFKSVDRLLKRLDDESI